MYVYRSSDAIVAIRTRVYTRAASGFVCEAVIFLTPDSKRFPLVRLVQVNSSEHTRRDTRYTP